MSIVRRIALVGAAAAAIVWVGAAAAATAPVAAASTMGPEELVRITADRMFTALDKNRAALTADSSKVAPLVDQILIPNFDVDYATRLVLASYWRSATPAQQQRFQKAFVSFLTRTYGKAVVGFERDRLKFLPMRGPLDPKRTFVQTEISRSSGGPIPVDYVLRQTPQGWKVFDLVIEGISYIRNYRQSFADEIEDQGRGDASKGIDAVIARLEAGTFQAPVAPATATKPATTAAAATGKSGA